MNEALERLREIQLELEELASEASQIFADEFSDLHNRGEAFGAFELGSSSNQHDTTLSSLIDEAQQSMENEA